MDIAFIELLDAYSFLPSKCPMNCMQNFGENRRFSPVLGAFKRLAKSPDHMDQNFLLRRHLEGYHHRSPQHCRRLAS